MKVFAGAPAASPLRLAIVVSRFNHLVSVRLLEGATAELSRRGVAAEDVDVAWVPGAFEIPLVAGRFATGGSCDAVIALGAVIRGETTHFELIATEAARGIAEVARSSGVPVIFEVLATDDLDQARSRAGGAHGNKGWEAAEAALEMAALLEEIGKGEAG